MELTWCAKCAKPHDADCPRKRKAWARRSVKHSRPHILKSVKDAVRALQGANCAICGGTEGKQELDHVVNVESGGSSAFENLQYLCKKCHNTKTHAEAHAARFEK